MKITSVALPWAAALLTLLSACGGGGGGGGSAAGTAAAGDVSYGTITAFGSVWVNGVEYGTSGTSVRIDDQPGLESDLRIGMVVRVDGSIAGRSASTITVDSALKGRVEQRLDANRLVVLGQTVQVDDLTRLEDGVVAAVGDEVEVHGTVVADGTIAAGHVQRQRAPATPPFALKGYARNHDSAAQTFAIGALVVRYAGAAVSDLPAGSWNGRLLEVKGSACAGSPVCGTLTATRVSAGGLRVSEVARAHVEGFVTTLGAAGFSLGNQSVVTTPTTLFAGGALADIGVGTRLEAEGPVSGGVLTATKVSLRDNVRLEADVASVDTATGVLTLAGLPGVTVAVNTLTAFRGEAGSIAALAATQHLRIRGRLGAGNTVVATELERRSTGPDTRLVLQAPVSAVSGTDSLTLLGRVVTTQTVADAGFKDVHDVSIGRAAFYAAVRPGLRVKARAELGAAGPVWNEVELED